jgi:hypothetical protein
VAISTTTVDLRLARAGYADVEQGIGLYPLIGSGMSDRPSVLDLSH